MTQRTYQDFEIRVEKEGDRYRARVIQSPAGGASAVFTLPYFADDKLGKLKLDSLMLCLAGRRVYRKTPTEETQAAQELGAELFDALFSGEISECFRKSMAQACSAENSGLRLKLRFLQVPELAELPWEYLFDKSSCWFPAQSHLTPVVRYVDAGPVQPLPVKLPLKILAAASAPGEYVSLDIKQEKELLNQALEPLLRKDKVRLTWLEDASFKSIQRILRREDFHIFHFVGHGGFDTKRDEGGLYLDDGTGRGVWISASRIGVLLNDHRSMRLAVLNACEGARISDRDAFAGVATTLIQRGIPAVVAMQFEISDRAAIVFAEEFYAAITDRMPADAAVAEARKAVYGMPNDVEWGTPVLYMRVPDGMLFRFDETSSEPSVQKKKEPTRPKSPEKELTNGIGMKFVYIPPGTFMMGQTESEKKLLIEHAGQETYDKYYARELPRHEVKLTKGFYMQTTQVTLRQWRAFAWETSFKTEAETGGGSYIWTGSEWEMKEGYYWDNPGFEQTDRHPVTCVSWNDVQAFINWLNKKESTDRYRLPTEAEWEYACRAGTETPFFFGDCLSADDQANYDGNYPMPGCPKGKYREKTVPVASFPPNAWGLYDMHGNVLEWVQDWYGDYPSGSVIDPSGPGSGSNRVLRGGSWYGYAWRCRSAYRDWYVPGGRGGNDGFRLALLPRSAGQ